MMPFNFGNWGMSPFMSGMYQPMQQMFQAPMRGGEQAPPAMPYATAMGGPQVQSALDALQRMRGSYGGGSGGGQSGGQSGGIDPLNGPMPKQRPAPSAQSQSDGGKVLPMNLWNQMGLWDRLWAEGAGYSGGTPTGTDWINSGYAQKALFGKDRSYRKY